MAAAQEWGGAISQAIGYEEGEFIEAYRELDKIQRNNYLDLYVVGTSEGLERSRSLDDVGKVDKNQYIVIRECINILL